MQIKQNKVFTTESNLMPAFNPKTNPEGQLLDKLTKETDRLFSTFSIPFLSEQTGIPQSTLGSHKCRQKLSPPAVIKICKIKEVKAEGFTERGLRPDLAEPIDYWANDRKRMMY
jgi:hypothetical protein